MTMTVDNELGSTESILVIKTEIPSRLAFSNSVEIDWSDVLSVIFTGRPLDVRRPICEALTGNAFQRFYGTLCIIESKLLTMVVAKIKLYCIAMQMVR